MIDQIEQNRDVIDSFDIEADELVAEEEGETSLVPSYVFEEAVILDDNVTTVGNEEVVILDDNVTIVGNEEAVTLDDNVTTVVNEEAVILDDNVTIVGNEEVVTLDDNVSTVMESEIEEVYPSATRYKRRKVNRPNRYD